MGGGVRLEQWVRYACRTGATGRTSCFFVCRRGARWYRQGVDSKGIGFERSKSRVVGLAGGFESQGRRSRGISWARCGMRGWRWLPASWLTGAPASGSDHDVIRNLIGAPIDGVTAWSRPWSGRWSETSRTVVRSHSLMVGDLGHSDSAVSTSARSCSGMRRSSMRL